MLSIPFNNLPCSVSRPEHPPDVVNICLEYLRTNYQVSSNHIIELRKLSRETYFKLFGQRADKKGLVSGRLACTSSNTVVPVSSGQHKINRQQHNST